MISMGQLSSTMKNFGLILLVLLISLTSLSPIQEVQAATRNGIDCLTPVYQTGLVLHLDAGSPCQTGSTSTWLDSSGNNRDLTFTGTPTYDSANQKSYGFGGTAFGTVSSGFSDFTSGISISFYMRWTSNTGAWQRVMDFGYSSSGSLYVPQSENILVSRHGSSRDITLEFYRGAASQGHCMTNSGTAITANVWTHYAIVINPSGADKCKFFINGSAVTTATDPTYPNGGPVNITRNSNFIGESNWSSDDVIAGSISDLALYNVALTDAQVSANYTAQTSTAPANTAVPTISGTRTFGQVLTTTNGTWSNSPTSYSYQWSRSATSGGSYTNISGATGSTHTLVAADVGQYLKSTVTAINGGGSASSTSSATLQISKATPTFSSWSNVTKTFGDANYTVTAPSVTGSLAGSFGYGSSNTGVISISGTTFAVAGGGSATITATFTPNDTANYNTATTTNTVTVNKAAQSAITITTTTATYGSNLTLASTGGSTGGTYNYTKVSGNCSLAGAVLTPTATGSCVVQSSLATTANYLAETSTATTITIASGSSTASLTLAPGNFVFRQAKLITAVSTVAGKITFRVAGKILPGCKNKTVNAGNSFTTTCSYRPSNHSIVTISATLDPTDSYYTGNVTSSAQYLVSRRTGPR
jgi:hypothetical protein